MANFTLDTLSEGWPFSFFVVVAIDTLDVSQNMPRTLLLMSYFFVTIVLKMAFHAHHSWQLSPSILEWNKVARKGTEGEGVGIDPLNGHLFDEDGRKPTNMMSKHYMQCVSEAW